MYSVSMLVVPRCWERKCKHFEGASSGPEQDQFVKCAAFPRGVPNDIAYGNDLHLEPQKGDGGITYEKGER